MLSSLLLEQGCQTLADTDFAYDLFEQTSFCRHVIGILTNNGSVYAATDCANRSCHRHNYCDARRQPKTCTEAAEYAESQASAGPCRTADGGSGPFAGETVNDDPRLIVPCDDCGVAKV